MSKPQPPEPVNVTLFEKRIFADIIKDFEMRSAWIQVGPNSNDRWICRRGHMKTRGRDWSYATTAKEHREPPEAGSSRKAFPWSLQREHGPAYPWISDCWPPEL